MIDARIAGIGVLGPGLTGWPAARNILAGIDPYVAGPVEPPPPAGLSPRERRRTSPAVRLALAVAQEAVEDAKDDPKDLPVVFGWAHGDGPVVQRILEELATPDRFVSPTDFHNSVHNVAVGYWSIASGSHQSCSSIAAAADTFPASLLKALAQVRSESRRVLLVVCEVPFLEPLDAVSPVGAPFGMALNLAPIDDDGVARLAADFQPRAAGDATPPETAALRPLWEANPAARAIPLLEAIACGVSADIHIPYGAEGQLVLSVSP